HLPLPRHTLPVGRTEATGWAERRRHGDAETRGHGDGRIAASRPLSITASVPPLAVAGRCAELRRLRRDHDPQRLVLQVSELRGNERLFIMSPKLLGGASQDAPWLTWFDQ